MQHAAIFIQGDTDKEWLIKELLNDNIPGNEFRLKSLKGQVYSNSLLQHYINEEIRHDNIEINTGLNNTLAYASAGEQRKALFSFILSGNPAFIILDDVFESLDKAARETLIEKLQEVSNTTLFVQVLNRKEDLLPFINTIYLLKGKILTASQDRYTFIKSADRVMIQPRIAPVPSPLHHYEAPGYPLIKMNQVSVRYNGRPILQNICWQN